MAYDTQFSEQAILNRAFDPASGALKMTGASSGGGGGGDALSVKEQYRPNYEKPSLGIAAVEQQFSVLATGTTSGTTVVKGTDGFVHRFIVTGGTAGTIDIYANSAASGTKLASFSSTNAMASYEFNAVSPTGITVVTSANTQWSLIGR